jgi:hypothetical protein
MCSGLMSPCVWPYMSPDCARGSGGWGSGEGGASLWRGCRDAGAAQGRHQRSLPGGGQQACALVTAAAAAAAAADLQEVGHRVVGHVDGRVRERLYEVLRVPGQPRAQAKGARAGPLVEPACGGGRAWG